MIKFRALVAEFFEHFGEQRVNAEAFKVAEARQKHTPVLRPFPDRVSIEKEWMIGQSDMIALWAPLLAEVDARYIDSYKEEDDPWWMALEDASYKVIARIASGHILQRGKQAYSEHAQIMDLRSTSCVKGVGTVTEGLSWPEHLAPLNLQSYRTLWGQYKELWPRKAGDNLEPFKFTSVAADTVEEVPEVAEYAETGGSGLGTANDTFLKIELDMQEDDDSTREAVQDFIGDREIVGYQNGEFGFQYGEEYITTESIRVAQLSTPGIALYALNRLSTRCTQLKRVLVHAQGALETALQAKEAIEEDEREMAKIEQKYKEIMGYKKEVEMDNAFRSEKVNRQKGLNVGLSGSGGMLESLIRRRG